MKFIDRTSATGRLAVASLNVSSQLYLKYGGFFLLIQTFFILIGLAANTNGWYGVNVLFALVFGVGTLFVLTPWTLATIGAASIAVGTAPGTPSISETSKKLMKGILLFALSETLLFVVLATLKFARYPGAAGIILVMLVLIVFIILIWGAPPVWYKRITWMFVFGLGFMAAVYIFEGPPTYSKAELAHIEWEKKRAEYLDDQLTSVIENLNPSKHLSQAELQQIAEIEYRISQGGTLSKTIKALNSLVGNLPSITLQYTPSFREVNEWVPPGTYRVSVTGLEYKFRCANNMGGGGNTYGWENGTPHKGEVRVNGAMRDEKFTTHDGNIRINIDIPSNRRTCTLVKTGERETITLNPYMS